MSRARGAVRSLLSIRTYVQSLRLAHFSAYAHALQVPRLQRGADVSFAPNVSFRNAERIRLGEGTHVGEHSLLWAGDSTGTITLGRQCLLGPHVMLTASNYGTEQGTPVMDQPKIERDIVVGDDVWIGANAVVTAGVTIGDGAVIGAGAVVTRDIPPQSIAAGVPARVIGMRALSAAAGAVGPVDAPKEAEVPA